MNYIKCPKCGKEEPAFDYAHVCGPVELKQTVMNERIKELALECYNPYSNFDHEKFAKLIVEECAVVIEQNLYKGIGWNTSRAVKRHFGIGDEE